MYLVAQKVNGLAFLLSGSLSTCSGGPNPSPDLPGLHEFATVLPATGWSGCTKGTNVGCYLALQSGRAAARKRNGL